MDKFNLEVISNVVSEASLGRTELCLQLKINGQVIANGHSYPINPIELLKAKDESGSYEIWTCNCGIAECAGISTNVNVTHEKNTIKWQWTDMPFAKDSLYVFDLQEYQTDINLAWKKFKEIAREYKKNKIEFDIYPDPLFTGLSKIIT